MENHLKLKALFEEYKQSKTNLRLTVLRHQPQEQERL